MNSEDPGEWGEVWSGAPTSTDRRDEQRQDRGLKGGDRCSTSLGPELLPIRGPTDQRGTILRQHLTRVFVPGGGVGGGLP